MKATQADKERIHTLNGVYVGQLTQDELEAFNRCVENFFAIRDYNTAGILGLAKVKVIDTQNTS